MVDVASLTKYLKPLTKQERAKFLLKYAQVHAACFDTGRVDENGYRRFVKVRERYYRSDEWKD